MKIAIYGFGTSPAFFKEIPKLVQGIDWYMILPTYHFREEMELLLGKDNVFYLQKELNNEMKNRKSNDVLANYPGNIYKDMATDKSELRKRPKEYQLQNAISTYLVYKKWLSEKKPAYVVFPIIESHDAMILYKVCVELGIKPVIHTGTRNLGVSYFSDSPNEDLPPYAEKVVSEEHRKRAKTFLYEFRKKFKSPKLEPYEPKPEEIFEWRKAPFLSRTARYLRSLLAREEPHYISETTMTLKIKVNLLPLTKIVRSIKARVAKRYFEMKNVTQAPLRFVYYPLQYTPEASINALAPYFVDQRRAIDTILYALPSKYLLLVKEHPVMEGIRPFSFYNELKHKPGLVLVDPSVSSAELTKKAALTVSVTGTACLEAFLIGRPALQLGKTFFTAWITEAKSMDLSDTVEKLLGTDINDEDVLEMLARIYAVSSDYVLYDPSDPYLQSKYVLNKRNAEAFLKALLKHMERLGG